MRNVTFCWGSGVKTQERIYWEGSSVLVKIPRAEGEGSRGVFLMKLIIEEIISADEGS